MTFKKVFFENTNFSEDIINIVLNYKEQLEKPNDIIDYLYENQHNYINKTLFLYNKVSLHDFLYYCKYYLYDFFNDKFIFKFSLIYVDDCHIKYDDFFHMKNFNFNDLNNILYLNFNYIYINRLNLSKSLLKIKLCDPEYDNVFRKKKISSSFKKIFKKYF